jgi:hypothetical protein
MSIKLKKNWLIISFSIVLFSLISISIAQAGCIEVTVRYNDNCPRIGASVWIQSPIYLIGSTGEDGKAIKCDHYLLDGKYLVYALYPPPSGPQFGPNSSLTITNGSGSTTITDSDNPYPNGTESCGDSECDGYQYCYSGNPNYIECNSTNTKCDTKKCCNCTGGTKAQPTENYYVNDSDCPSCQQCSALDTCSNVSEGTDPKNNCGEGCQKCVSGSCQDWNATCSPPYPIFSDYLGICGWERADPQCISDSCDAAPDYQKPCNPFVAYDDNTNCWTTGLEHCSKTCGAECNQTSDCQNKCTGKQWYSNYSCNLGTCGCDLYNPICSVGHCNAECDSNDDCVSGLCNADCTCFIDTTLPQWSNNQPKSPLSVVYNSGATYNFNITWTDNIAVDDVILQMDGVNYSYKSGQLTNISNTYSMTFSTCTINSSVGGGCPFVYVWNGTDYILDNNLLPFSESKPGDVDDYYLLTQPLVEKDGKYSLLLKEFEHEHDYFDKVELLAVDHDSSFKIAVDPKGKILTYKEPVPAKSAIDNNGNDLTSILSSIDGEYHTGEKGEYIILDFGKVESKNAKFLLRDPSPFLVKTSIHVQVLVGNEWKEIVSIIPRSEWAMDAVDLSEQVRVGEELKVRLYFTDNHKIDFVGLDTSEQEKFEVKKADLIAAKHSTEGEVKERVIKADNIYTELVPGQQVELEFIIPEKRESIRDFILVSRGHYDKIKEILFKKLSDEYSPPSKSAVISSGLNNIFTNLFKFLTGGIVRAAGTSDPCLNISTHYYRWYANDTSNNWNSTGTFNFTIHIIDPVFIYIDSPENKTYSTSSVDIKYTASSPFEISWIGYSLDNKTNVTLTGNTSINVAEGTHNIIFYANTTYSVMNSSDRIYFTVSLPKPDLIVEDIWTSGSKIYYRIKNQGNANAGYSYSKLYVDSYYKTIDYVPSLSAGSSSSEYFSYSWSCSGTSDTIKVCADSYYSVSESNENNNCMTKTFTCPVLSCSCTGWILTGECCAGNKGFQTRTCNPTGCAAESRCSGPCIEMY